MVTLLIYIVPLLLEHFTVYTIQYTILYCNTQKHMMNKDDKDILLVFKEIYN